MRHSHSDLVLQQQQLEQTVSAAPVFCISVCPCVTLIRAPQDLVAGDSTTLVGMGLKAGVGLVLSQHPHTGNVVISQVLPYGPASRSGNIHLGDSIASVSGVSTRGLSPEQVSSLLEGAIETEVEIEVSRICQTTGGPITV